MNIYNLCIIGFGVIGTEALEALNKNRSKINRKKFRIAIIERDLNNIPGGIAYSLSKSKFGFFNNPIRLSHPHFIKWIKNKKNFEKLVNFIKKNKDFYLQNWLKNNKKFFEMKKEISEIYLPRLVYSFYLEEKIIKAIKNLQKKNFQIDLFKGEVIKIKKKINLQINGVSDFKKFNLKKNRHKIFKNETKIFKKMILSKSLIISNGILPPSKIPEKDNLKNKNYIWDFYAEGGTENLLNKIENVSKVKSKILLAFIGNKAGLLETMQSLEKIILKKKINLKIISISNSHLTLQKAELSIDYNKFNFKYLRVNKLNVVKKSDDIYNLIKLEFDHAEKKGFNKYDVWTNILNKNILSYFYNQLSSTEKKRYNSIIFNTRKKRQT